MSGDLEAGEVMRGGNDRILHLKVNVDALQQVQLIVIVGCESFSGGFEVSSNDELEEI